MRTLTTLFLLATGGALLSHPSHAESYNLRCTSEYDNEPIAILVIRQNWLSQRLPPDIRVVTRWEIGGTVPVLIKNYTEDQIQVSISVVVDRWPNQKSELELTINRNTGNAHWVFKGAWKTIPNGVSYQEQLGNGTDGICVREAPKF